MNKDELEVKLMVNKLEENPGHYHIHFANAKWFPWYDACEKRLWQNDVEFEHMEIHDFLEKYPDSEFKLVNARPQTIDTL